MDVSRIEPRQDYSIDTEFLEAEIGGAPKELKETIVKIRALMADSNDSELMKFFKPNLGIVLYGPPNSGKTYIARKIPKLLNIKPENVCVLYSFEKMKYIFPDSKPDDWKALVLDISDLFGELGKLVRNFRENPIPCLRVEREVSELMSLVPTIYIKERNLVFIFTLIRPQEQRHFDDKLTHLFETKIPLTLPDKNGRKEMFQFGTKKIQNRGFLDPDVDLDTLANLTEGFDGGMIDDVVRHCYGYAIRRLYEKEVPSEQALEHPDAKITQADFERAIIEVPQKLQKQKQNIQTMYI